MGSHWTGDSKLSNGQDTIQKDDRVGFKIKPARLHIIWGKDKRYWRINIDSDGTAELLQVCWLEVNGTIPIKDLDPGTYSLSFRIEMRPDAFGWNNNPVFFMLKVGEEKRRWKSFKLAGKQAEILKIPPEFLFEIKESDDRTKDLSFGMYEIWRETWKGGMIIHEVLITKK